MTRHLPNDDDISVFRQALQAAGVRRIASNQADPASLSATTKLLSKHVDKRR